MPRYFIDTDDGDRLVADAEGLDFVDSESALAAAIKALPDMARDKLPNSNYNYAVVVRNERDVVLCRATLTLKIDRREPLV